MSHVAPAYELACGSSSGGCKSTEQIAMNDELHAVWCCVDTNLGSSWVDKCPTMSVFGESKVGLVGASKVCNRAMT